MRIASFSCARLALSILPALLLVSATPAQASPQSPAVESFDRTVPLSFGGSFSISNVNGSIEIEGWDREAVQISARKFTVGPAGSLRRVDITVEVHPASVAVLTHYPEDGAAAVSVEFRVRVPARVRLQAVNTINGSVAVHDVAGAGSLFTVNGNVILLRGAGLFSARTTNGSVSLELLSLSGGLASEPGTPSLTAQSTNGSVAVALPPTAGAELDAATRNGDFSSELPLFATTSAAGRSIHGRVGSGGPLLRLRTVNGSIRLRIAQPLV